MKVVYFVMRYPAVTQTFIEREMFALVGQGVSIEVRPIWDFRSALRTDRNLPPGLTIVRPGPPWRVLAAMVVGIARELVRCPGLPVRGLRLLFGNLPRHAEGWFMTGWGSGFKGFDRHGGPRAGGGVPARARRGTPGRVPRHLGDRPGDDGGGVG